MRRGGRERVEDKVDRGSWTKRRFGRFCKYGIGGGRRDWDLFVGMGRQGRI
jgi:hypothetical protein